MDITGMKIWLLVVLHTFIHSHYFYAISAPYNPEHSYTILNTFFLNIFQ